MIALLHPKVGLARWHTRFVAVAVALLAAGPVAAQRTIVEFWSEVGDPIGAGYRWSFTEDSSVLFVSSSTSHRIEMIVVGSTQQTWYLAFSAPTRSEGLVLGLYDPAGSLPTATIGAVDVSGEGRGCGGSSASSFEVLELERSDDGSVVALAVDFRQLCHASTGALHGRLRYNSRLPEPTPRPTRTIRVPAEFSTIQSAIDASGDGDTILVAAGNYLGPIDSNGKFIQLVSEDGPAVTHILGRPDTATVRLYRGADARTGLHGFTIRGGYEGVIASGATEGPFVTGNVIVDSRTGLFLGGTATAVGNTIRKCLWGMELSGDSSTVLVAENHFSDVDTAIYLNAAGRPRVERNAIVAGRGVWMFGATRAFVANNLILTRNFGVEATVPISGRLDLLHNTIVSSNSSAVQVFGFFAGSLIANNILWSQAVAPAVKCEQRGSARIESNNLINDRGAYFSTECATGNLMELNYVHAAEFVDAARGDYRLRPGSPNIDRGVFLDVLDDFEGHPRPLDGNGDGVASPDIGYDEVDIATLGPCPGDCNDDTRVTVSELVLAVRIAVEGRSMGGCPNADADGNGRVTIGDLLAAVRSAIHGCWATGPSLE